MMRHAFNPRNRMAAEPVMTPLARRVSRYAENAACAFGVVVAMGMFGMLMDIERQCRAGGVGPGVPGPAGAFGVLVIGGMLIGGACSIADFATKRLLFRLGGYRCRACGRALRGRRDRCCFAALPQPPARSGVTR